MDAGFAEPLYIEGLSESDRAQRVTAAPDFRVLRDRAGVHYFVRGVIEIPVAGAGDVFCYGVWTTLSAASYGQARAAYADNRAAGPFFGWLANRVPGYATTLSLKTNVTVRPDLKPAIVLQGSDHSLAREQQIGITPRRLQQIIEKVLHPDAPASH